MKKKRLILILSLALFASILLALGNFLPSRADRFSPGLARQYNALARAASLLEENLSSAPLLAAPAALDTVVTDVHPTPNSQNAPLTATLAITLSGAINETTVSAETVFVHGGGHGHMDGDITFGSIHYDSHQNFFPGELVQTSVTDGVLDLNGTPITPYIWQFRAAAGVGPGTFVDSGQNLVVGGAPTAIALGDLDGDDDLDAFIGKWNANKVWLNDGMGNFTDSGQNLGNSITQDVALGDLDGDGDLDVFEANSSNQPNKVWLNDGEGTFTDSGQNLISAWSHAIALGDVDGDGDLDAFVGTVNSLPDKVWLNDGMGNFTDSGQNLGSTVTYAVALGDLDGDGDLDAFVGNTLPQPSKVWLNDGMGNFTANSQNIGNSLLEDVVLGDLDGDGDLDAFVGSDSFGGSPPNRVWLNDGNGTFTDSGQNLEGSSTRSVALGDVDGDGDLDAFVGNWGDPNRVLLNDGDGIFANNGQNLAPSTTSDEALGDLDGDGDLDAFVGNTNAQPSKVWLNDIPPFTVTFIDPPVNNHTAPVNATLAITLSRAISEPTVSTQTVFVHGSGHGHMDGAISFSSILYDPHQDFFPGEAVETSVTTGVLDSNGTPLAVPYVWQFRTAAGVGPGGFSDSDQSLGFFESRSVALGDLDGDGDLDAFVANYISQPNQVWLNDGMGNFSNSGQNLGSEWSQSVALGDLDGDGDLDAFVGNWDQPNTVWLNDGAGTFTDSGQSLGNSDSFGVVLGDLDGDGDLDAFEGNWNQPNKIWLNDGTGMFTDNGQALGSFLTIAVALGDVDEDGDLDAFVANRNQPNKIWLNNGTAIFTDSGQNLGSANCADVGLGDVDGDGDLDAYVVNSNQPNKLWRNNGVGIFTDSGQNLGTANAAAVVLGDVNGDGDLDAFVANTLDPNTVWWNNGSGTFANSGQSLGGSGSWTVALGDLDGDDDLDAFVGYWALEPNKVWLNEVPEMDVSSNGQSIQDGDTTPSTSDGTNFNSTFTTGGAVTHTFTIHNTGEGNLSLTSTPAIVLTTGTHFTVTIQPTGSAIVPGDVITFEITFDPLASGTFIDTVTIANNDLNENPYTFMISGVGINTPPIAGNDAYTTTEDVPLLIAAPGVLTNDTDGDGDPLNAVWEAGPANGGLTLNSNGSFDYTPNADYCGADSFTYHAHDGIDSSSPAIVSLSVTCVSDAPLALGDIYTATEDVPLVIAAPGVLTNDTDGDDDPLTAVLDTDASHGNLTLNSNGSFTYTSNSDYCGTDSFTYHAHDGQVASNLAFVALTVTCVDDTPLAVGDAYTTTEDGSLLIIAPGVLANDTDVDSAPLTAVWNAGPGNGNLTLNSDGSFDFTPNTDFCGMNSFIYHATDGTSDSNVALVSLVVTCVNDSPLTADDTYTTSVDVPLVITAPGVLANDTDAEGDALTVVLDTDPQTGTLALQADGSFVYTPAPGYIGLVTFTYIASDGIDSSEPETVTIIVQAAPGTEFMIYLPAVIR